MKKLIVRFPRPGDNPYDTRVEVSFIENSEQRTAICRFLEEAGFTVDSASNEDTVHARHLTTEPAAAEAVVRALGQNGFVEPLTDRYNTSTPSQTSSC